MPEISDELLMAYVDNELNELDRARVEDYLLHNPRGAERLAVFATTGKVLSQVYDRPMREPVPQRLIDAVLQGAASHALTSSRKSAEIIPFARARQPQQEQSWLLIAACTAILASGAGVYWAYLSGGHAERYGLAALPDGSKIAGAEIASALDIVPSGASVERTIAETTATVRPVFTFVSSAGGYCRQYEILKPDTSALAGVACRNADGRWRVEGQKSIAAPASGGPASGGVEIKPAGNAANASIDGIVNRLISGDVLGSGEEARIIKNAWRNTTGPANGS